ncbi:MAG TPA: hypothetical protein DEF82_00210 [Crocinitomicaceae bacterium]|nr:hypothetical protein [Flavobacteriales bacterium]HBW85212.1 hypothetical protein [Crocinitomicaceae bacterium]
MKSILIFTAFLVVFSACSKYEGQGGAATIKGVVIEQRYNSLGNVIASYPAPDQDVFIIYGADNSFYDDDIKTSFDGSYEFRYMRKGIYRIFTYEDCITCPSGKKEIIREVEITKKNQEFIVDTIYIKKF